MEESLVWTDRDVDKQRQTITGIQTSGVTPKAVRREKERAKEKRGHRKRHGDT